MKEEEKENTLRRSYAPQTFTKVLSLLKCFSLEQPELSLKEIGQKINISFSSLYRYLTAMEDEGYIWKNPETNKYTIGLRLVELGGIALSRMDFRRHGQIALDKLSEDLQMNSNIGVLYEGDLMHIAFAVHIDAGPHHSVIGRRTSAHCTAMGKVLLASSGCEQAHQIIDRYGWRSMTPQSINDFQRLDHELSEICQNGFAVDRQEASTSSFCIAYPVVARNSRVVASMSVSSSIEKFEKDYERISFYLRNSAEQLSYDIGYMGKYPFIRYQNDYYHEFPNEYII